MYRESVKNGLRAEGEKVIRHTVPPSSSTADTPANPATTNGPAEALPLGLLMAVLTRVFANNDQYCAGRPKGGLQGWWRGVGGRDIFLLCCRWDFPRASSDAGAGGTVFTALRCSSFSCTLRLTCREHVHVVASPPPGSFRLRRFVGEAPDDDRDYCR